MANVSRPLIALLVGTVAFFALWLVALKPSSSTSNGGSQGLGTYPSAIAKAHQAVATSNAASVAHGGVVATSPAASTTVASGPGTAARASAPASTVRVLPATRHRLDIVSRALQANKVVALLLFNPAAADDKAVKQELAAVPNHGGKVVKLAAPLSELARYTVVTTQVPVNVSPTLVLIDSDQQATTIVGFADRFEITQRVSDALAVK
jgi:riboflavin biosynthesis pyrimidine reductase